MPYSKVTDHPECSGKVAVIKDDDGRLISSHDDEQMADLLIAALYAQEAAVEAEASGGPVTEAGARHSRTDTRMLQDIHDHAVKLGAVCPGAQEAEMVEQPVFPPQPSTGAMIAFFLPGSLARFLVIPGGEAAEELHITLAYLGEAADLVNVESLKAAVAHFAGKHAPIEGRLNGVGVFSAVQEDGTIPLYATFDSPQLPPFRQALMKCLAEGAFPADHQHGFIPHVTLRYMPADEGIPAAYIANFPIPVMFESLALCIGDDRYYYTLGRSMEAETPFSRYSHLNFAPPAEAQNSPAAFRQWANETAAKMTAADRTAEAILTWTKKKG